MEIWKTILNEIYEKYKPLISLQYLACHHLLLVIMRVHHCHPPAMHGPFYGKNGGIVNLKKYKPLISLDILHDHHLLLVMTIHLIESVKGGCLICIREKKNHEIIVEM